MKRLLSWSALLAFLWVCVHVPPLPPPDPSWRAPRLFPETVLQATYTPTPVQSVQPVTVTWSSASNTGTATLSTTLKSVTNALLVQSGSTAPDAVSGLLGCHAGVTAVLTNTSTVTAYLGGTAGTCNPNGSAAVWQGFVVEYLGQFVKSGLSARINLPNAATPASQAATITAVNTAKTVVAFTGWGTDHVFALAGAGGDNTACQLTPKLVLTDATHITASTCGTNVGNGSGNFNAQVGYSYVEFR